MIENSRFEAALCCNYDEKGKQMAKDESRKDRW